MSSSQLSKKSEKNHYNIMVLLITIFLLMAFLKYTFGQNEVLFDKDEIRPSLKKESKKENKNHSKSFTYDEQSVKELSRSMEQVQIHKESVLTQNTVSSEEAEASAQRKVYPELLDIEKKMEKNRDESAAQLRNIMLSETNLNYASTVKGIDLLSKVNPENNQAVVDVLTEKIALISKAEDNFSKNDKYNLISYSVSLLATHASSNEILQTKVEEILTQVNDTQLKDHILKTLTTYNPDFKFSKEGPENTGPWDNPGPSQEAE